MDSVVVHRKSRLWEFTLHFSKILPIMLYRSLAQHLTVAFKEIAQVKLNILADDQTFDEQLLQDYWAQALENQQCDTPLTQQVLKTQVPVIKDVSHLANRQYRGYFIFETAILTVSRRVVRQLRIPEISYRTRSG